MTEHEIDYRVVKGQIVAQCYSKPHLRQSGDIDFWVNPKDIKCCEEADRERFNGDSSAE